MIETQEIPWELIDPNEWNPNRQSDVQYAAELGSLRRFGFVAPTLVRPHPEQPGRFQIVDGFHRWSGARDLAAQLEAGDLPDDVHPNLLAHLKAGTIPTVVLDLSDTAARELTVVLNETRGSADPVLLGALVQELTQLGTELAELAAVLPFSTEELGEMMKLPEFNWEELNAHLAAGAPTVDDDGLGITLHAGHVSAHLDPEQFARWTLLVADLRTKGIVTAALPAEAHAQVIAHLLDSHYQGAN